MERITNLSAPPVVGKWYLVPTSAYQWLGVKAARPWPVFLPWHSDAEHLRFDEDHYHVDPRFLGRAAWKMAQGWGGVEFLDPTNRALSACQRWPLARHRGRDDLPGDIVWRRRRCERATAEYVHGDKPTIVSLTAAFAGRQCKRARSGWVCPHQHVPMGSVPVEDGVLTCPLHGLRIRDSDGVVLAHRDAA